MSELLKLLQCYDSDDMVITQHVGGDTQSMHRIEEEETSTCIVPLTQEEAPQRGGGEGDEEGWRPQQRRYVREVQRSWPAWNTWWFAGMS